MTTDLNGLNLLGVSGKEQQIYDALLEVGGVASASGLAKHASIKRPTVYLHLEQLKQKGLIVQVVNGNKKYFKAVSNSALKSLIRSKISQLRRLENTLPKAMKQSKTNRALLSTNNALVYDGVEACRALIEEIAKSNEQLYFIGSMKSVNKFFDPSLINQIYTRPHRKKLLTDYIIADWNPATIKAFYEESGLFTKRRFLPKEQKPNGCLACWGNKLIVAHFLTKPYVVVIEEPTIVALFKMAFFALWKDLEGKNIPPHP